MTCQFRGVITLCLFLFVALASTASAQQPQVFALPDAHSGEGYRVELETVLRERYGLKLESGARNAIIQWALADGDLPVGISVRTDGTIIGQPEVGRTDPYRFRLRVVDVSVKDDELVLDFTLTVKRGRLKVSKIEGPRLVPVGMRELEGGDSSAAQIDALKTQEKQTATNAAVRSKDLTPDPASTQAAAATQTLAQIKTNATPATQQD